MQLKDEEIPRAHWGRKHPWSLFMYVSEWLYKRVSPYSPNCYPAFPKTVWEGLSLNLNSKPLLSIKHCFNQTLKLCVKSVKFHKHLHIEKILKNWRSRRFFLIKFLEKVHKNKDGKITPLLCQVPFPCPEILLSCLFHFRSQTLRTQTQIRSTKR